MQQQISCRGGNCLSYIHYSSSLQSVWCAWADPWSAPIAIQPSIHPHLWWWLNFRQVAGGSTISVTSFIGLIDRSPMPAFSAGEPMWNLRVLRLKGFGHPRSLSSTSTISRWKQLPSLSSFSGCFRKHAVLLSTDNTTVISTSENRGGGRTLVPFISKPRNSCFGAETWRLCSQSDTYRAGWTCWRTFCPENTSFFRPSGHRINW